LRNSKISISKPKLASTNKSTCGFENAQLNPCPSKNHNLTRSATLAISIIELISLLHSTIVNLRFFPDTIVTGPLICDILCLVKFFTKHFIKVDLPTFGGPTTATRMGGGSVDDRSTTGICFFLSCISSVLEIKLIQNNFMNDNFLSPSDFSGYFIY
jgi:hypothetical protein